MKRKIEEKLLEKEEGFGRGDTSQLKKRALCPKEEQRERRRGKNTLR